MDKRFLVGIAYNLLIEPGEHVGELQIRAASGDDEDARHRLYHDPAIRLPKEEMMRDGGDFHWRDKPILVSHQGGAVGRINSTRIVDKQLHISAEVTDPDTIKRIDSGELKNFSVGYDVVTGAEGQRRFQVKEVSLCRVPFFDGCAISVVASKDGGVVTPPSPSPPSPWQTMLDQRLSEAGIRSLKEALQRGSDSAHGTTIFPPLYAIAASPNSKSPHLYRAGAGAGTAYSRRHRERQ